MPTYPKMVVFLLLGRSDGAIQMMEQNPPSFNAQVYADPLFDPVRDDPRFERLVELGLRREVDLP